jgi:hypothetical protein
LSVVTINNRLQAQSIGDQILCTNLGIDWQASGYTLALRVKLKNATSRDLALNAVALQPQQAFHNTTASSFPVAGDYDAQIIGKNGITEERFSEVFKISVAGNLPTP